MRARYQGRNVEVREEGSGAPLVLVHGYPLDGDMWIPVSRALAGRFRVLRPDLPSRRDTPHPPSPTIGEYATWIVAVAEACGSPCGVAGFSLGGYVVLELLKRKPAFVAAAAFVDTRADPDDEKARAARNSAIFTAREMGPTAVSDGMIPKLLSPAALRNRSLVNAVRAMTRRQNPNSLENDLLAMQNRPGSSEFLAEIGIPCLVVRGSLDSITPESAAELMASRIPGARRVTIEGAGHLTPMEKPAEVAAAIGDFFQQTLKQ
ncbi:MAG: alpha/beta fold hydrolase [Thermoanaerobaculia bacterium]